MQLTSPIDNKKLYDISWITGVTLVGGPLGAFYMITQNFKTLGDPSKANKNTIIGIVFIIVLFGIIFFLPDSIFNKIPHAFIPLALAFFMKFYAEAMQGKDVKTAIQQGTKKYSFFRILLIAMLSLIVTFGMIMLSAEVLGDRFKI